MIAYKKNTPLVTIITAVKNGEMFIDDAIKSVIFQTYKNIEYIIIDNLSTDHTLQIISNYGNQITKVISEQDYGIYDAMNKGLSMANGEIVGFLNADDFYANNRVIEQVVNSFTSETDALYADLNYVSRHNKSKIVRKWQSGLYNTNSFLYGWMPPHPTFFVRLSVYKKFGGFNLNLKSAADYELMLRLIYLHKICVAYLPEVIVAMRLGGHSNRSLINRIKANLEDRKAWRINQIKPKWFTLLLKPIRKVGQYFL